MKKSENVLVVHSHVKSIQFQSAIRFNGTMHGGIYLGPGGGGLSKDAGRCLSIEYVKGVGADLVDYKHKRPWHVPATNIKDVEYYTQAEIDEINAEIAARAQKAS